MYSFFYCVKDSTIATYGEVAGMSIALSFLFLIESTDDVDGTLVSKCIVGTSQQLSRPRHLISNQLDNYIYEYILYELYNPLLIITPPLEFPSV